MYKTTFTLDECLKMDRYLEFLKSFLKTQQLMAEMNNSLHDISADNNYLSLISGISRLQDKIVILKEEIGKTEYGEQDYKFIFEDQKFNTINCSVSKEECDYNLCYAIVIASMQLAKQYPDFNVENIKIECGGMKNE